MQICMYGVKSITNQIWDEIILLAAFEASIYNCNFTTFLLIKLMDGIENLGNQFNWFSTRIRKENVLFLQFFFLLLLDVSVCVCTWYGTQNCVFILLCIVLSLLSLLLLRLPVACSNIIRNACSIRCLRSLKSTRSIYLFKLKPK